MFESSVELTPEQVEWLDKCTKGTWQLNPRTGLVDVNGDFDCGGQELSDFKGVRFGVVRGDFVCDNNQLTTLVGAPQKVGGSFNCHNNPVDNKTLKSIFGIMETGKGYLESVEYLWPEISLDDQILLYRPEFEWVGADEARKLEALKAYQGFKGMI